jgi:hypothetical protein
MSKFFKIILIIFGVGIGLYILFGILSGFGSTFNSGAQIQKAQEQATQNK